jgi:glyoxylase-like metal-dependent hydrolase (beta-lactamase superfamily II)
MVEITKRAHSIDGFTHPSPGGKVVPYLFIENIDEDDLTLIDPSFLPQLPILEDYIHNLGYEMKNIKRIILTHLHIDHAQAANEIRNRTGAKIYSHWIEAGYLAHNPPYPGPPTAQATQEILKKSGLSLEELTKKFGSINLEPIIVDNQVSDGDMIGNLKVIHTPGHTPGHISLYHSEDRTIFGADSIYKNVFGADHMYIAPAIVSIDPVTAVLSAQRLSKIKFDKLLMSHQDSPLVERARETVEQLVSNTIGQIRPQNNA